MTVDLKSEVKMQIETQLYDDHRITLCNGSSIHIHMNAVLGYNKPVLTIGVEKYSPDWNKSLCITSQEDFEMLIASLNTAWKSIQTKQK